jgi:tripartite-type tricarboxylate transporter receptor subunit TctC
VDVLANVVAGRVDYMMTPISLALPDIRAGRLYALGVSGSHRSSLLKDVPTIAEAGVARFDFPIWYGLWTPAGTPERVVDQLATDVARVLATPALRDWMAEHGAERMNMTRADFTRLVTAESKNAAQIIRAAGVTP